MNDTIRVRAAEGTWVARADGAVIAESGAALELSEGDHPGLIFFPRTDVAMAFVEPSATVTTCPRKGQARYFNIISSSGTITDAAVSYEAPLNGAERIAGHLSFDGSKVTVERL